jgi:hypothetical protein
VKSVLIFCFLFLGSTVGHTAAANYYDQFLYEATGDCKDIKTVWFLSAASWKDAKLGLDTKDRELQASLHLQLFPDGTYWALYKELALVEMNPKGIQFETVFEKGVAGTWAAHGDSLDVSGLGVGTAAKIGALKNIDGFHFQFTTALHDSRALGANTDISRVGTNTGPHGVSINQYCGVTH